MFQRIAGCLTVAFLLGTAAADARPIVQATLSEAIVTQDATGHVKLEPVTSGAFLKPGTLVQYTIVATNSGDSAARNFKPAAKIPAGTTYKSGSASSDVAQAKPEFSLDGGRTWSTTPMLVAPNAHGVSTNQIASSDLYTTVRWTDPQNLAPHTTAEFSYEVSVK